MPRDGARSGTRAFALLASEQGLEGFVHGREPIETIGLPSEPTLDDMLAAEILSLRIAGQKPPAGLRAFAPCDAVCSRWVTSEGNQGKPVAD